MKCFRQEKWEEEKSYWEEVELVVMAEGGRPVPMIYWYINDISNDELSENELFRYQ